MKLTTILGLAAVLTTLAVPAVHSDTIMFAYEADTWPWEAGFLIADACDNDCVDWLADGRYILNLDPGLGSGGHNYSRVITFPGNPPPQPFWLEWRFRSNYSYLDSGGFWLDDARVFVEYDFVGRSTWMWGDAAFDSSICCAIFDLPMEEFHTYRFEVPAQNTSSLRFVDGQFLAELPSPGPNNGQSYVQFGGTGGGAGGGPYRNLTDEWDYVRYGQIEFGETLVASVPETGFIDPRQDQTAGRTNQGIDRFTVTFDVPNGLRVDQITVASTAPPVQAPFVEWVTRPDADDGATWEVRLDHPIPPGHRVRFMISDEAEAASVGQVGATNVVEYAFLPGDVNQDEATTATDILVLVGALNGRTTDVLLHDINRSGVVASADVLRLVQLLNGVNSSQAWAGVSLPPWP